MRNMNRFIEKNIEDKIAEIIIDSFGKKLVGIGLSATKDGDIEVTSI